MRYLDLTLPEPAESLALDEALLEEAEQAGCPLETLRVWEPRRTMVVVGRSSTIEAELRPEACRELDIPVLRRPSGGAAVLSGPGCLMYALVLSLRRRPRLRWVEQAHRLVLGTLAEALRPLVPGVRCRGISDLAVGDRKFSGNSLRLKRDHLLYHGTVLYDFPLELIGRCLKMPARRPKYRRDRTHGEFLMNLPLQRAAICRALAAAWEADEPCGQWPEERTARLAAEKYGRQQWE